MAKNAELVWFSARSKKLYVIKEYGEGYPTGTRPPTCRENKPSVLLDRKHGKVVPIHDCYYIGEL